MAIIKKNKIVFVLFALSIVGIVMSFFSYHRAVEGIEMENFKESMRDYTKVRLESTKEYISDMVYDLNAMARTVARSGSIWNPQVEKILFVANQMDMFAFTAVVDQNGNGYTDVGSPLNIADEEYFKTAMQGTEAFSEVQQSKVLQGKSIQIFACPIWSEKHEVMGVALGVLDLENLNEAIRSKHANGEGNLYIVDSNGNYISCFLVDRNTSEYVNFWEDVEALSSLDKGIEDIKQDFERRREGGFSYCDNGQRRYGCYMPIGIRNWQIVYTIKDSSVDQTLDALFYIDINHIVFISICYFVWVFCVAWYFINANKEVKHAHEEVKNNMETLYVALEYCKQPIFTYHPERRELTLKTDFSNPFFQGVSDSATPESFVERKIIAPDSVEDFKRLFETIKTQQDAKADIQINNDKEGNWWRITLHNIYKEKTIVSTVGFLEDITELKRMEGQTKRKLELQEALIAKALMYAKVDLEAQRLLEMDGEDSQIPFEEFLQNRVIAHVRSEDREHVARELSLHTLRSKFQQGTDTIETQFRMDFAGKERWVSCMGYRSPVKPSKLILIISDIDRKKRQEIALKSQAERDGLTGLYNAATVRAKIEEALAYGYLSGEKQIFILLDLDNYKLINDTFGHSSGDQVLVEMAQRLQKRFRSSDIIGRMGGDEFVLLLRNINTDQDAETLLQELCEMLHQTYTRDEEEVTLSASVGVAWAPGDGHTFAELYQKSDVALYQVKKQSKNGYKYYGEAEE